MGPDYRTLRRMHTRTLYQLLCMSSRSVTCAYSYRALAREQVSKPPGYHPTGGFLFGSLFQTYLAALLDNQSAPALLTGLRVGIHCNCWFLLTNPSGWLLCGSRLTFLCPQTFL